MSSESIGIPQCVGRFQFALPKELQITGRSQSLYDVQLKTVAMPQGGVRALVEAETKRVQALTPPKGVAQIFIRNVDLQSNIGNIKGIWYFSDADDADIRGLEAFLPAVDHAVVAMRTALIGKEGAVEKLVTAVLSGYVASTAQGFCVGDGWVAVEPGRTEEALISLKHASVPKFEIRITTTTVAEPDTRTYSNVDEEKQVIEGMGGSQSVLRDHEVSAAGLRGKEIWLSAKSPNDPPFVRFTWHFPGIGGDGLHPMVNVLATAPKEQQAQLEVVWDGLLKSLRQVPAAAAR